MPVTEAYLGENLATKKVKRKRSKLTLLALPILVFIFFMGWSMYWIGDRKRPKAKNRKAPKEDNVTLLPIIPEEPQTIKSDY